MLRPSPEVLINLIVIRSVSAIMLRIKLLVVLLHLTLLLLRQLIRLVAGDALVGHLGLGRCVLGRSVEGLAAARDAFGTALCQAVDEGAVGILGFFLAKRAGLVEGTGEGCEARRDAGCWAEGSEEAHVGDGFGIVLLIF